MPKLIITDRLGKKSEIAYDCNFTLLDLSDAKPFFVTTGKKMRRTNIVLKKATSNG